jgi:hypothetical protein
MDGVRVDFVEFLEATLHALVILQEAELEAVLVGQEAHMTVVPTLRLAHASPNACARAQAAHT